MMVLEATEHASPAEALQHLDAAGHDHAISIGGRCFTCSTREFQRLEEAGFQPTTWHNHDGQIVSVPGRDC
jgi:hypothetical protein